MYLLTFALVGLICPPTVWGKVWHTDGEKMSGLWDKLPDPTMRSICDHKRLLDVYGFVLWQSATLPELALTLPPGGEQLWTAQRQPMASPRHI